MLRPSLPKVVVRFDLSGKRVTTPLDMFWPKICATAVWTLVFVTLAELASRSPLLDKAAGVGSSIEVRLLG
jgi:hypothetical protein